MHIFYSVNIFYLLAAVHQKIHKDLPSNCGFLFLPSNCGNLVFMANPDETRIAEMLENLIWYKITVFKAEYHCLHDDSSQLPLHYRSNVCGPYFI